MLKKYFTFFFLCCVILLSFGSCEQNKQNLLSYDAIQVDNPQKKHSILRYLFICYGQYGNTPPALLMLKPDNEMFYKTEYKSADQYASYAREILKTTNKLWFAFCVENNTQVDNWILASSGKGFAPSQIVIVEESGNSIVILKNELEKLRHEASLSAVITYQLILKANQKSTIYLQFDKGTSFGSSISLWSADALFEKMERLSAFSGSLYGISVSVAITIVFLTFGAFFSIWNGIKLKKRLLMLLLHILFPVLAILSVFFGFANDGVSALYSNQNVFVYVLSVVFFLLALIIDGICIAIAKTTKLLVNGVVLRIAYASIFCYSAFSLNSAISSLVPLIEVTLYLFLNVIIKLVFMVNSLKKIIEDKNRLLIKTDSTLDNSKNFVIATASALNAPACALANTLDGLSNRAEYCSLQELKTDLLMAQAEATKLAVLVKTILVPSGHDPSQVSYEEFCLSTLIKTAIKMIKITLIGKNICIRQDVPPIMMYSDIQTLFKIIYNAINRCCNNKTAQNIFICAKYDSSNVYISIYDDGNNLYSKACSKNIISDISDLEYMAIVSMSNRIYANFSYRQNREDDKYSNEHYFEIPRYGVEKISTNSVGLDMTLNEFVFPVKLKNDIPDEIAIDDNENNNLNSLGDIFLVGEESISLISTKRSLEDANWNAFVYLSAKRALDDIQSDKKCSLVVINSTMADIDGFLFCEKLRQNKKFEILPVIMLLDSSNPLEIEKLYKSGANDYIVKPASHIELIFRIRMHVHLAVSRKNEMNQMSRMAEFDKYKTLAFLSAGVAHEINTPNNAVLRNIPMLKEIWNNFIPLLENSYSQNDNFQIKGFSYKDLLIEIPEMLNDTYMGAQDIKRIVAGLKDYSRTPEDNSVNKVVNVNETCLYAIRLLKHSIIVSTNNFDLDLCPNDLFILADRLKLTQVIVNVFENALQSLPDRQHRVSLKTFSSLIDQKEYVVIEVSDTGCGIEYKNLESVFDPFFTTKRDKGGSGLGLAVVQGIIFEFNGTVSIESQQNIGTTVTIKIPSIKEDQI